MKPKRIWANLAVDDLERTKAFYTKLGFKSNGGNDDLVSFFFGDDDFIIHFFRTEKVREGLEGEVADLSKGNEIVFTLSADSKSEYDLYVNEINEAGGTILFDSNKDRKPYYDENGYYVCVFTDPDGHKFNFLYGENM